MTTVPNVARDTRLRYWQKILQKYQNQSQADARNNIKFNAGLRRTQVSVLKAMSQQQANLYLTMPLRRVEATMIRTVTKQ